MLSTVTPNVCEEYLTEASFKTRDLLQKKNWTFTGLQTCTNSPVFGPTPYYA